MDEIHTEKLDQRIAQLCASLPRVIDLGLGRMHDLLHRLGNPHLRVPPVVHIAGTNGKGSTLAMLQAILQSANFRVHRYSSPHLVSYCERISLDGVDISPKRLLAYLEQALEANDNTPISQFELFTAAAFLGFAEHSADILLLETGLGGLYDATNVVAQPELVLISAIGHDHKEFLGEDIATIASQKAGIMKPDVVTIAAPDDAIAAQAIKSIARTIGNELRIDDWSHSINARGWEYHDGHRTRQFARPGLSGIHQMDNAALAVTAIDQLRRQSWKIPEQSIHDGLKLVVWPGRLQLVCIGKGVVGPAKLWLDGGHNLHAANMLAKSLAERENPISMICAIHENKDVQGYLQALAPCISQMIATCTPQDGASMAPDHLASIARSAGIDARHADTPEIALAMAQDYGDVICCGSLYFVGYLLRRGLVTQYN